MDQRKKERIIAEETSRFMDGNFGQLDLSGSPDLNHPPAEEKFELQDRHGFNRVDESGLAGINHLKELLANPPREVIEEIANETGNLELISELAHERAEDVAHEFRRLNPGYLKCDGNWRSIVETLAHNFLAEDDLEAEDAQELLIANGHWTLPNLTASYKTLDRAGALEYPANHARPLKETQRLRSAQLAANGDVLGAITQYVEGRLGQEAGYQAAFALDDPFVFTTDPKIRPFLEEAVFFAWENYRKDYSPTADRRWFLREYCAGRFVTVALLDAAWEECKCVEKEATRSALLNQVGNETEETIESTSASFERLDDASIDDLYHRTLREYARTAKRQSGVLV
ncbi:MAG: hypothetical protein ABR881_29600 [Candidatus Sulfotelmatobacter sp.]|jgi:hypothetical protein